MQSTQKRIRVLVVDDSMLARKVIIDGLRSYPNFEIVGYAVNATDAQNKIHQLNPDVMVCDVQMPGMSGIDFLKKLLPEHPLPVVLVSSLHLGVFDTLHAGAIDFVRKPDGTQSIDTFVSALAQKVEVASCARVRRPASSAVPACTPALGNSSIGQTIIGLGASTGGTEATLEVLRHLPEDIPGMVIVQHMPPGFTKMYADRLNRLCKMEVREATDADEIKRGLILVAPADFQCRVVRTPSGGYHVRCTQEVKVSGHRPSVDALFSSIAETVKCRTVGILLTGMGRDGASGLLEMRRKGAFTIGQDKESSVVYGMPSAAYDMGAVMVQASCEQIASILLQHLKIT